ncbi:hypothetical protein WKR88_19630 [Trinickia caryophylli]|nr:hypothetical protein [Trinickia caryophylli]WQE12445.1 hypothetical protein U0034_03190 [Trinickia caryophylli]
MSTATAGNDGQCDERQDHAARTTHRVVCDGAGYSIPKALKPLE